LLGNPQSDILKHILFNDFGHFVGRIDVAARATPSMPEMINKSMKLDSI
jgi:hypothetical protein